MIYISIAEAPHRNRLLIFLAESDVAIGYVQATVGKAKADIAWLIGTQWQGTRYASEAATALTSWLVTCHVGDIGAHIHPKHIASQLVAKAAGLHNSGHIEDSEEVWLK